MAPTRKSRSVNKRYSDYVEVSPSKNVANKSGRQKRKLSDMLGFPWTDEEVERFYKAYRKYGKDWKKVAAMVRSRNSEMVEALYTMNRAYLSLPEGTASVVGFIAMVSDHYNAMEGSDNNQEINDFPKLNPKPKKRTTEDQSRSRIVASSDRRLPPLKIRESDGCTVRKRTPRFPINHSSKRDISGNHVKRTLKREVDDVAHGAALALTEAFQYRMKTTPSKSRQKMLGSMRSKLHGNLIDGDCFEGSSGSLGAENAIGQKGRKYYGKKEKEIEIEKDENNEFDDGGEACSGTGEGLAVGNGIDVNIEQSSSQPQGKRKRNKNLLFRDETSALDALETLANLSLMIQSDSPVLKEDKPPTGQRRHKTKVSADKPNEFPKADASRSGKSKSGRESKVDYKALSEGKHLDRSIPKSWKRKNKSSSFEALAEKGGNKVTGGDEDDSKNCKSTRLVEYSSSNSNTSRTGAADSAISTALLPASDLPAKRRNRRKVAPNHQEMKLETDLLNNKTQSPEGAHYLKEKAFRQLSSPNVRRWSTFEWFYSAIDYPWFAKREFVEYLNHVGLGHIPRLTKVEWGVIRSSLGKPRRFSRNFLLEEREKLWQYRDSVRKHYSDLRNGKREGLPTDLARPLTVGQRVVAIHPESRQVHDGSVLTVDHDKCRIQFDRPELGVAFVKDIDCMPFNLLEIMPEALRRESSALYRFSLNPGETVLSQTDTRSLMLNTSSEQRMVHNGSGVPIKHAENVISSSVSQIQARETDIRALSDLARALDKKEAILTELKLVNDGLTSHKNETGIDMKVSESFKKEYAILLLQLKEASDQVTFALLNLRQRNTYPGNNTWKKSQPNSSGVAGPTSCVNNQLAPNVVEVVNNSRLEADKLVHTALQAMSKIKVELDVRSSVASVLDFLNMGKTHGSSAIRSSEQANNGGAYKHSTTSPNHAPDSDEIESTVPFDLIVSCVDTYRMIQRCTERQYPPADVVQMLDSTVSKMHPQCAQNLGLFREIQMCMARVKTQILARVPS